MDSNGGLEPIIKFPKLLRFPDKVLVVDGEGEFEEASLDFGISSKCLTRMVPLGFTSVTSILGDDLSPFNFT